MWHVIVSQRMLMDGQGCAPMLIPPVIKYGTDGERTPSLVAFHNVSEDV